MDFAFLDGLLLGTLIGLLCGGTLGALAVIIVQRNDDGGR